MQERLQKIISGAGLASRRAAETMIAEGRVAVNGQVAEIGQTADPEKDSRFRSWPSGDTYIIYPGNTSSIRWERLVQGIESFEKWHIMMEDAKAKNNKSMQRRLNKLLEILDINKIANESERMTKEFRDGLNALSASKKY